VPDNSRCPSPDRTLDGADCMNQRNSSRVSPFVLRVNNQHVQRPAILGEYSRSAIRKITCCSSFVRSDEAAAMTWVQWTARPPPD